MKDQQVGKKIIKDRVGQPRRRNMILEKMQQLFLQEGEDRIYQVVKTGDCQTRNMEYIHPKECGIFEGRFLCKKWKRSLVPACVGTDFSTKLHMN